MFSEDPGTAVQPALLTRTGARIYTLKVTKRRMRIVGGHYVADLVKPAVQFGPQTVATGDLVACDVRGEPAVVGCHHRVRSAVGALKWEWGPGAERSRCSAVESHGI